MGKKQMMCRPESEQKRKHMRWIGCELDSGQLDREDAADVLIYAGRATLRIYGGLVLVIDDRWRLRGHPGATAEDTAGGIEAITHDRRIDRESPSAHL